MTTHTVGPPLVGRQLQAKPPRGSPSGTSLSIQEPWTAMLSNTHRDHLVANIVGYAGKDVVTTDTKARVGEYWRQVSPDLGARVAKGLGNGG